MGEQEMNDHARAENYRTAVDSKTPPVVDIFTARRKASEDARPPPRNGVPKPMRSVPFPNAARSLLAASLLLLAAGVSKADPMQTYVALGDALAFGQTGSTPQASYGDQGYVQQFATYLGTKNNGIVPNVINLAIPGETSSTYFSADDTSAASRAAGVSANLNYGNDTSLSQTSFLAGVAAAERAAGRTITTVSFALGLGDYLALTGSSGFSQMTLTQQQSAIQQMLGTLQSNYVSALSQIRGTLPNANLYLLNYYNPYSSLGPNNVNNELFTTFVNGQNQIIQSLAPQFNASIVNLSSLTANSANIGSNTGTGFPYPTSAGYSAIGNSLISVAEAPEPGTLSLLAFGVAGFAGSGWIRRRAG
jgi:lysophospholipase L1-like esterase